MSGLWLAEELLLVALDDEKGTTSSMVSLDPGLAGAVLVDLLGAGAVQEAGDRLEPAPEAEPLASPLHADALAAIRAQEKPKKVRYWVDRLQKELKPIKGRTADGLVARGVLSEDRHKSLGFIPSTRYPATDAGPEREVRSRLEAALVHGVEPDPQTTRLIALLHALDLVKEVVPKEDRKAAKVRAKALAESDAVGRAVKGAIDEIYATVAVLAAVGAAGSAGSS